MADGTATILPREIGVVALPPLTRLFEESDEVRFACSPEEAKLIVKQAIKDSSLVGDTRWLNDISLQKYLEFAARVLGEKKRDHEDISVLTHYIQVAHRMVNTPQLIRNDRSYVAFVGATHDALEDMGKYGVKMPDILYCWRGHTWFRKFIEEDVRHLTDDPNLSGTPRLEEQLKRTGTMSEVASYARLYDKITNYLSDIKNVATGRIVFDETSEALEYVTKMNLKAKIVEALKVHDKYKTEMKSIVKSLSATVHSHLTNYISFAEMMRHAGNALVRRIAVERVMLVGRAAQLQFNSLLSL